MHGYFYPWFPSSNKLMRFLILGKWETTCTLSHESANVIMCCATSEVRYLPCVSDSLNHSPRLYLRWHNIYIYIENRNTCCKQDACTYYMCHHWTRSRNITTAISLTSLAPSSGKLLDWANAEVTSLSHAVTTLASRWQYLLDGIGCWSNNKKSTKLNHVYTWMDNK